MRPANSSPRKQTRPIFSLQTYLEKWVTKYINFQFFTNLGIFLTKYMKECHGYGLKMLQNDKV